MGDTTIPHMPNKKIKISYLTNRAKSTKTCGILLLVFSEQLNKKFVFYQFFNYVLVLCFTTFFILNSSYYEGVTLMYSVITQNSTGNGQ